MRGGALALPLFFLMLSQIIFTKYGANQIVGGFEPGMVARVFPALARHLVEEARVARYDGVQPRGLEQPVAPVKRTRTKRKE